MDSNGGDACRRNVAPRSQGKPWKQFRPLWRKRLALSQEPPAKLNLDAKYFLQLLEGYAPAVLEVTHAVSQQLEKAALNLDAKHLLQLLEGSAPVVLEVTHSVLQQLEKAAPSLVALAQTDWASLKRAMDELPEKSKAAMILALSKGWFFGWHDGLESLMDLVETLNVTPSADIDEVMAQYYLINLESFTDELTSRYPSRAPAIRAAVNAHSSLGCEGFLLSVPVFIAQADGLLTEITEVKSAMMKDRKGNGQELQASKALREKLVDPESLDLAHPILMLHESDFMKSAEARQIAAQASGESFTALNRHQVLHGESSDYGTEINSLKAFSFLVHVGLHLPVVLKNKRV